MDRPRLRQAVIEYQTAGIRNPGRPLQRLLDTATGTGHEAKSLKTC